MPNREACGPCARRKVRCDKQEPSCSNCRRRKGDLCVYAPLAPSDRIKRLETLVRKLGGDPSTFKSQVADSKRSVAQSSTDPAQTETDTNPPIQVRSADPIVVEEDGHSFYVESRAWQDWLGKGTSKNPFTTRKRPHAFGDLIAPNDQHNVELWSRHPSPERASILWSVFVQRVDPIVRIAFRWRSAKLQGRSTDPEYVRSLSDLEHALVLSIYLVSIASLSDEECTNWLQESRSYLLLQYQTLCEEALLRTSLFCMTDVMVIKALTFYMMATFDRLVSTQSLWSLMGLTLRNAEKLGLHRDGTALGLTPEQTEERRRVWWQLQHIDLCLGICGGLTPMTLMADWDANLPLNIEDDDISPTTTTMPQERPALTSISYCRFTYWVIDTQRRAFRAKQGRFALSWQSNASLDPKLKDDVMTEIEEGLNKEFLQYCDPIKPLDTLLQLSARFLVVGMRLRLLHGSAFHGSQKKEATDEVRAALFDSAVKCLRYGIEISSRNELQKFRWYTKIMFSWHAFMFVLVEASRENDILKAQETWDLLANVYASNASLFQLADDRRRHHAAELVTAAWRAWQHKFGANARHMSPPSFVTQLEIGLAAFGTNMGQEEVLMPGQHQDAKADVLPITPESVMTGDTNNIFDMDVQDIDWSFWNSME